MPLVQPPCKVEILPATTTAAALLKVLAMPLVASCPYSMLLFLGCKISVLTVSPTSGCPHVPLFPCLCPPPALPPTVIEHL